MPLRDAGSRLRDPRRNAVRCAAFAFGLIASCLAAPSLAQQQDEVEQERARQGAAGVERTLETAGEAELLRTLEEGQTVTYQQVLANPDDVALNYLYAQSQVRTGELRGAAATLERILLIRPDLPRARLLYAVVLFRLDSVEESERQFEQVREYDLPDRLQREVARYLEEIALRKKRTRYTAALSAGGQFDTNRNSSPRSGERLVQLGAGPASRFRVDLDDASQEQDDFSVVGLAELRFDHDLGLDAGHRLRGAVSYYAADQEDQDDFDLRAVSGQVGGLYRAEFVDLTPTLYATLVELSSETFFRNVGLSLRLDRRLSPRLALYSDLRFEWQDFDATRQSATSNERTGWRGDVVLGTTLQLNPIHRLGAELTLTNKQARGSSRDQTERVFAYVGQTLRLRHTWLLGHGQFLLTTLSYGRDAYRRADVRVTSARSRRDLKARVSVLYGAPLGFLLGPLPLPEAVEDVLLSVNAEYYRASSNITNYSFNNTKVGLLFTKTWSF